MGNEWHTEATEERQMSLAVEIVGWVGALLVLLAYGFLSAHKLSSRSTTYQVLNIAGSIGLVINSFWNGAIPSAAVNIIWMGIGAHALWRMPRQGS
jgi:hypothetical protein